MATPEDRASLQFALVGERPLHCAALHRPSTVDEAEAARPLNEKLDDRFRATKTEFTPPLRVRLDDGHGPQILVAARDFRHALLLILPTGGSFVLRHCRSCSNRQHRKRAHKRRYLTHLKPPSQEQTKWIFHY